VVFITSNTATFRNCTHWLQPIETIHFFTKSRSLSISLRDGKLHKPIRFYCVPILEGSVRNLERNDGYECYHGNYMYRTERDDAYTTVIYNDVNSSVPGT